MKSSIVFVVILSLMLAFGWGLNIYKLINDDFKPSYKEEVIRSVGIFVAPIGCIVGYMTIGDEQN